MLLCTSSVMPGVAYQGHEQNLGFLLHLQFHCLADGFGCGLRLGALGAVPGLTGGWKRGVSSEAAGQLSNRAMGQASAKSAGHTSDSFTRRAPVQKLLTGLANGKRACIKSDGPSSIEFAGFPWSVKPCTA